MLIMACSGSTPAISKVEGMQRKDSGSEHHVILHLHVLCTAVHVLRGSLAGLRPAGEGVCRTAQSV